MPLNSLVQKLFPDLHAVTPWTAFCNDVEMPSDAKTSSVIQFDIQWNSARPLPITHAQPVSWTQEIDSPSVQTRITNDFAILTVRTPFKVMPKEVKCPMNMSIGEIAASFLTMSKVQSSMVCMQNTQVIDPLLCVGDVNAELVLDFRVCPLLGGAKSEKTEVVRTKLKAMLRERGVPVEHVNERVTNLLAKVPPEKFVALGDQNDPDTWKTIKDLASAAQFRLITPAELKSFQQNARKQTPAKGSEEKKGNKFTPEAHAIRVDPAHFIADGSHVQLLEVSRFGPDQSGLCIVSPSEAQQCMQCGARSCDPLALLIIGEGVQSLGETFSLPAHLTNGSPVIVRACLLQFGDTPIEFKLQLPTAEVNQMQSTVIEFGIHKKYVGNWQDTMVPLHYVGVHVPALRGNNLLAVWSVKAWSNSKVAHHAQADHWHGYFRVADSLLPQVLARSGAAGIFMNPKTADKKHDPRYTTISLPVKQLSEVIAKAETCPKAMGIAKLGEGFGIRCKREDAAEIRASLMPESACVETCAFPQDQILFVAKNVPQVGREELTEALQKTGWEATAVRPQGMNRWILAASKDPTCSHVIVNGSIMMVERMHKRVDAVPITMVAREVRVNTTTDQQGVVSTTSRFAEFRAQVESQISQAVESKLQTAHARIEQLTQALQDVQSKSEQAHAVLVSDMSRIKEEQAFTQQKITEVENSVACSSQQIIAQMQAMFNKMQSNMEQTVQSLVNDPDKRQRTEISKADPFTPKA